MSQVNTCKYEALKSITGLDLQLNDMYLVYLQSNGATSGNLNDAESEMLISQGMVPSQRNQMWNELLISLGAPYQNITDNFNWFWCVNSGVIGPASNGD